MPEISDDQVDRLLDTPIPGGSAARDWFLPHETPRGLNNVRDVVRAMVRTWEARRGVPFARGDLVDGLAVRVGPPSTIDGAERQDGSTRPNDTVALP